MPLKEHMLFVLLKVLVIYQNIIQLARNDDDISKVKLILNEIADSSLLDVPDPYYGGNLGFENVFNLLDNATNNIVNKLL